MKTSRLMKTLTSVIALFFVIAANAEDEVTPERAATPTNHLRYGLFFSSRIKGGEFPGWNNASRLRSLCVQNGKMLKSNTELLSVSDEAVSDSLQALSGRVRAGDSALIYFGGLRIYDKRRWDETLLSVSNFVAALSALPQGVKVAVIAEDADSALSFVDEARGLVSPERAADIGWCAVDSGYEGVCRNQVYEWGEVRTSKPMGMTSFVNFLSSGVKDGSTDANKDGLVSVEEACAHAEATSQTNVVEVLREASGKRYGEEMVYPAACSVRIEGYELLSELCLGASDANRSAMWTCEPLTFEPADFGSVMECASLGQALSAAGGVPPYEFEEVLPESGESQLPPGLSLDPSGRFLGHCHKAGNYSFEIYVEDDKLNSESARFTLTVTENPNRPPVLDSAFPAVSWARLTSPGRAQEFAVSATDPEGAALTYCWTLDGEPIAEAKGASLALAGGDLPDDGYEHVLTCTVSDGVWTDYVAHSWTLWRETFDDVRAETANGYTWYHQDGSIFAVTPQPVGKVTVPSLFYDEVVHFGVETNFNKKTGEPIVRVYDEPVTERVENVFCEISGAVFSGCRGLTDVILPSGIEWIAEDAFDGSPDLKRISMPVGGNGCYFTRDGVLYEGDLHDSCSLVRVPEGCEAASFDGLVGPRVEGIYEHAFLNCAKLTAIEVNAFSAEAAVNASYAGCASFTAFAWKGPKPRLYDEGWFVRNGALCSGYAYSEDGYGEFTLRKVPAGLESFTVDSSIRWIDTWAFVGATVRDLVFESTSSYTLEELLGNLTEVLVGWPEDGFVSPVRRVVYRSTGSDSYAWKTFIRNFQNDYPQTDVTFEETREASWYENWGWSVRCTFRGDDYETASVVGWYFGMNGQPSGAVTLPAFYYRVGTAYDPSTGSWVQKNTPLAIAVECVSSRAFSGMEDVTSITFPYTIQWIDWETESENLLPNVRELVFEGRIPDGFYELVAAAPNLERIVYSANPRYSEDWESVANDFEGVAFVKGAEPAEPQFEFECSGEAYLVSVWPAKGEVKVPAVWNACPVRGIDSDAFAEATEMTKLLLPASICEIDEYMLEGAVALEEIEVYQPTRGEFFAKLDSGRLDYGETFDFWKYDCDIWHYTSEDGALFAECETWFWDFKRGEDVLGTRRRLVKCPAAKAAFDFTNDVHEVSDCALVGGSRAVRFNERPYAPEGLDTALCEAFVCEDEESPNTNACTVVYPYGGWVNFYGDGCSWRDFVGIFRSSYPEGLVTFEPYFLPDVKEDYEWGGWCEPGAGAVLIGLTLGSVRNPSGAVTVPATLDGQPVAQIAVVDAFAYFGSVTSIRFPYTLRLISFDSSLAAFGAVTELIFDGGVPEGFDYLVSAMPNLKTVIYSANPRYKAEWLQVAANHVKFEFTKGEIPSEPQWYFDGENLGDGHALDDPDGFAAVWPAPEGEVTVPFMQVQTLVQGISENAFKGCDKITKIRLPSCVCDLSLRTFDDCAALEAVEFYTPTREEYEAVAPYWESDEWDENDKPHLVRYYEPSYGEVFGEYACSEFYSRDGLLMYGDYLGRVPRAWGGTLAVPENYRLYEGALAGCSNVTRIVFSGYSEIDNLLSLAEAPQLRTVVYPGEPWLAEYWEGVKAEAVLIPELADITFEPMQPGELVWNADLEGGAYLWGDERYPAFWCAGEPPVDFVFPTFIGNYPLVGLGENTLAGVSNLTSITLPYTVRHVDNLGCDLSGVTRLVFEGGVPEGFDELVGAASNLNTVVYSANPRYEDDWIWAASNHVGVAFVKGGIPSEPQWYVEDGTLGGSGMYVGWDEDGTFWSDGYPCVWPAPEGVVEVPATWAGAPIYEIAPGAFYGMDKITSLKLPRVAWIGEEAFRGCASLAAFEMPEWDDPCEEDPAAYFVEDGVLLGYDEESGWYPAAKEGADYELPQPGIVFDGCQHLETATVAEWMVAEEYVSLATFATCPNFKRMNVVRKPGEEEYDLVFRDGLILADAGRELVGFTARAEKVTIPATVESIRESAFAGMVGLSEVVFTGYVPSGVEAVAWACPGARIVYPSAPWFVDDWRDTAAGFAGDESLSNVVFAASVPTGAEWCASPEWGYGAFLYGWADPECGYSCVWGVTPEGALELPGMVNGFPVTGVSGDAFWGLTNLTSITFPYTVESVGAVEGDLSSVTELVFWGGVPSGLDDMLASLSNVAKIVYSANPRFAQGWADFIAEAAESHQSISFEKGGIPSEPQWCVQDGVLGGEGMWWEWDDASGKDVLVGFPCVWPAPEGAVEAPATWAGEPICGIAAGAFYGMDKITSLKLPRVEGIGEEAFRGCTSLAAFEMEEPNVYRYEEDGEEFYDWYDNSPYYVESGVLLDINAEIGWYPAMKEGADYDMPYRNIVFDGCAFLETVTASAFWYDERPLTLGDFRTCPNFREVVVRDQKVYHSEDGWHSFRGGMVFCDNGHWLVGFLSCGERAQVTGNVYGADDNAFAGCRNLKVAVVGYQLIAEGYVSLTSFGDSPDFERIELANWWSGEFEEKDGAFVRDGYVLAGFAARSDKVVIPGCVSYVNDCAFAGLENLSEIVCLGAVPANFDYALLNAGVLPKIAVSPNPRFAEGWAEFARMMKDEYALDVAVETRPFSGETEWCYDVEWEWNEQEEMDIAYAILRGDDNGFPCVWPVPEDGRLVIPETIDGYTVIGVRDGAFCGLTNLTAVTFPATARWLEDWCFYEDCSNLVEVTMPCSMSGFCPNDNARIHLTLVPAKRVDGVGDEWTLRVDHGVGLEGDCFCGLPALTEVTLAEGVWELGCSAFSDCPNLAKVTLPSSLWNIESEAFMCCDALRAAYFLGDAPVVFEDTFAETTNFTAYVCVGTTGWSGIEGDAEIPATWYAGFAAHPISGFDVDVSLMVGANVWSNLTVAAGTQVSDLPFPTEGGVYANLGWYADAALSQAIDGNLRIPVAGEVFYANRRLDLVRHMDGSGFAFTTGEGAEAWYGSELTAPKGGAAAETETVPYPSDINALTDQEFEDLMENGLLPHAPWMETKVTGPCYFAYSVYRSPIGAETLLAAEPEELVVLTVDGVKADDRSVWKSATGWTTLYYLVGEGEHTVRWTSAVAMDLLVGEPDDWAGIEVPVAATVGDIAADAFGPRKTLGDWTEKLVRYRSWNEGDLAGFAKAEEAKFADGAEGYAARVRHAYATLMQLSERSAFKDFCASAGLQVDYLFGAVDASAAFGAGTAGVNETVDRVVAEDLPLVEQALADLGAIPTNWTGRVVLSAKDYPLDADVSLDQADLHFLRASLHGVLAAVRYLAGYDLDVSWEKLRTLRDDCVGDLKGCSNRNAVVFQRFCDEQTAFFTKSRDRESLVASREQVRAALADALAADRLATARTDSEQHLVNYDDRDEAAYRKLRTVFDNLHLAAESLEQAVDVDAEAIWAQGGEPGVSLAEATGVDPSLLPNGWVTRVYLGALFNGKINRKYFPETYLGADSNIVIRLETMRDPTFAGLLPQMTMACVSNLVDNCYSGTVEHCEWTPVRTIAFESNGGSAIGSLEFYPGEEMDPPAAPVRTGYAFAGWFADPALTAPFSFAVMPDDDAVAYAKWTANAYEVDFNARGGTGSMPAQAMTYDEEAALASNLFSRVGYEFLGWTDAPDVVEEVLYYDGVVVSNLTAEADGEFDLYAIWAANEYAVAFDANGGSGEMAVQAFLYDEAQPLSPNAFAKTGYAFAGWATSPTGEVVYADGAVVSNLTAEAGATALLYAIWRESVYTVAFDPGAEDASGKTESLSGVRYLQGIELPKCGFVRDGYQFVGWQLGERVFLPGESKRSLCERDGDTVTLTALWEEDVSDLVRLTLHANGGIDSTQDLWLKPGDPIGADECPFAVPGSVFIGWFTAAQGGEKVTEVAEGLADLYAHWQKDTKPTKTTASVVFCANDGSGRCMTNEWRVGTAFGTPACPFGAPAESVFAGWYYDEACRAAIASNATVKGDMSAFAGWNKTGGGTEPETPPLYGPWGDGAVEGTGQLVPTVLSNVRVTLEGAPAEYGDSIRVYEMTSRKACGFGLVDGPNGSATLIVYAEEGSALAFELWQYGTDYGMTYDSTPDSTLEAPAPGSDVDGGVEIEFLGPDGVSQELRTGAAGWNVISLNVDPYVATPEGVFGSLGSVVEQVIPAGSAQLWRPGRTGTLKSVEAGMAYWVRTTVDNLRWTVSGTPADAKKSQALYAGWNLVGYVPQAARPVAAALRTAFADGLVTAVVDGSAIYRADVGGTLAEMTPGRAYWVYAPADGSLVYDAQTPLLAADRQDAVQAYGPWGDGSTMANPDRLAPTILSVGFNAAGAKAAEGDSVALYRMIGDVRVLCGLGRVGSDGLADVVCYAPKGEQLSVRLWVRETGVELPGYLDAEKPILAPAPGSGVDEPTWLEVALSSAGFAEPKVSVPEGETLRIHVKGGDSQKSTMVSVGLAYLTAASADLDLAKMTVDGVQTKKFPVTLRWDAGEIGDKEIVIPVKSDNSKEGDERFLLQLYDPVKLMLGETTVCTVTIEDRTKNSKTREDPYVTAVAVSSEGGSVTGSGYLVDKKKVTLKAKPAKNFRFVGWYPTLACASNELICTETTLVVDRTQKEKDKVGKQRVINGRDVTDDVQYYALFERQAENVVRVSVAYDAGCGKVTGAGYYAIKNAKTKVTVKATAAKGYVFVGWYDNAGGEEEFAGEPLSQAASYVLTAPEDDVDLAAKFVTVEEDMNAVVFGLHGRYATGGEAVTDARKKTTRTMELAARTEICGVPVNWPLDVGALTPVTVKAAKLPSGLKLVQDKETKDYSVTGVPTAASKVKNGERVPSQVVFTVTTAGKSSVTVKLNLTINPLPADLVGTYDGVVADNGGWLGCLADGIASLTVKANGGVSGKFTMNSSAGVKAFSFSAKSFSAWYEDDGVFVLEPEIKLGKKDVVKPTLYFEAKPGALGGRDLWTVWTFDDDLFAVEAVRNVWSDKSAVFPEGVVLPAFPNNAQVTFSEQKLGFDADEYVTLKFGAKGKVSVSAKFNVTAKGKSKLTSMTGSAQLMLTEFAQGEWSVLARVAIPAKKGTDFGGFYRTLSFKVSGGKVPSLEKSAMTLYPLSD